MNDPPSLESIFHVARRLPAGAGREAYIVEACGTDRILQSQLQALLKTDAAASGIFGSEGQGSGRSDEPPVSVLQALESRAGARLGVSLDEPVEDDAPVMVTEEARRLRDPSARYQVLGEIGHGGMGVVYKGRDQDLGRDVAVKVLKQEYAARPEYLSRFVEEAQIGGQLQHPGIVPVYEMGLQPDGQPYFAMKLVKGATLAAQLGRRSDPAEDRRRLLGVFEQICQTLAYAHARHVVHRDLKPSNVMIGAFGEVQVVDWGFAKVLPRGGVNDEGDSRQSTPDAQLSVIETLRSESGSESHSVSGTVMGTPAYMPPEQAQGEVETLDERSDVFGLGAILCEILTGAPPYCKEDGVVIKLAALAALDPARQRLAQCGADAVLIKLCLDCLEPARAARPASAQILAERVGAYLSSVEERARAAEVRAAELRTRQRMTLFGAAAGLLLLTTVALVLSAKNETIRIARDDAVEARDLAEVSEEQALQAAQRASLAEADAKARAEELQQVAAFQAEQLSELDVETMGVRLRRALIEAAPEERREQLTQNLAGLNFTSLALGSLEENLFDRTIAAIDGQFAEQPRVQAQLLQTIAETLALLGLLEMAADPQERALLIRRKELGSDHPDTLRSIARMGGLFEAQGKYGLAESYFHEALEARRRVLGSEHSDTLSTINALGGMYRNLGRLLESEPLLREDLDTRRRIFANDHPGTLIAIASMGRLRQAQGKFEEAEPYFFEVLEARRRVLGNDHPHTLAAINNLGLFLQLQLRVSEAEPYYREALEGNRRVHGDDHRETIISLQNMGACLFAQGKRSEGESFIREAIAGTRRALGDEHPVTLEALVLLGNMLKGLGRYSEAESLLRESFTGMRRVIGEEYRGTLVARTGLQEVYKMWLPLLIERLGADNLDTLAVLRNQAVFVASLDRAEAAEQLLLQCLDRRIGALGEDDADTLESFQDLATFYAQERRTDEAESLFLECHEKRMQVLGEGHPSTLESLEGLTRLLVDSQRWKAAAPRAQRLLELTPKSSVEFAERKQLLERIEAKRGE